MKSAFTQNSTQKISLDKIIQQQEKDKFQKCDNYKEFSILYKISQYLTNLHQNNQVHGNIRLSNILVDEDDSLNVTITSYDGITKDINYLVSLSPEAISNQEISEESDIYSLAVIILQVLTHKINIFSDYSNDINLLEQLITNNIKPLNISYKVPPSLNNTIYLSFSKDKSKRPTANKIQSILEKIYKEKLYEKQISQTKISNHKKKVKNYNYTQKKNKKNEDFSSKSLKSINIPSYIGTIGECFFNYCSSLKPIPIPSHIGKISESCFKGCSSLEPITIPSHIGTIGESCFKNCSSKEEEEEDISGDLKEEDIITIMEQSNVSRKKAIKALHEANGDLVTAVMNLAL